MKSLIPAVLAALPFVVSVPARSRGLESLSVEARGFDLVVPRLERPASSRAWALERIPGYGDLIHYLPSEPSFVTKENVKVWKLAPMTGYDSEREALSVMSYWRSLLAGSGLSVTEAEVVQGPAGGFEFRVTYTGDRYLALYESEEARADVASAQAARAAAESALRSAGLAVVKGFVVRGGGGYVVFVYYQAVHSKDSSDRLLARRHSPMTLFADESAAREQAGRESAVLAGLGIRVLEASVTSGPAGALHQIQYLGHGDTIREHVSGVFVDRAAAEAALETFVGALGSAGVLRSEVFPAGPWFEDGHAFSVRYAKRR